MKSSLDSRLNILVVIFLAWGAAIVATLWYMQVVKGEEFNNLALNNRIRLVRIPPPRGVIRDRNGEVIADNRPGFDVMVNLPEVESREKIVSALSDILNIDRSRIEERLETFRERPFEPVRVATDIGIVQATGLEEETPTLPGVDVQVNPIRNYPYGAGLVHLLGYVGQIGPEELEELKESGYRAQDDIGKIGVEKAYDRYLRGVAGGEQLQVNARGYRDKVLSRKEPRPGDEIQLTVDMRAQSILNELMEGWKGAAVALDPRDGSVLAMVSRPTFDPNLLVRPVLGRYVGEIFSDPEAPLLNRGLAGEYPAGSPFKLVVALAALRSGLLQPEDTVECRGSFELGTGSFGCWKEEGHGEVNLQEAIEQSCNVYFYKAGLAAGVEKIKETALDIGMGKVSGLELGGERGGNLPGKSWKKKTIGEPWYPGDTVNLSIGQGYLLVTPFQVARLGCVIASGGNLYQPRVIEKITSPEGEVIKEFPPKVENRLDLPVELWDEIRAGMYRVVNAERGTGRKAAHPEISVSGKTGTVQVGAPPDYETHAWFLAFAPSDEPEIVLAVLLEYAESGPESAAPLVGEFMERYFAE